MTAIKFICLLLSTLVAFIKSTNIETSSKGNAYVKSIYINSNCNYLNANLNKNQLLANSYEIDTLIIKFESEIPTSNNSNFYNQLMIKFSPKNYFDIIVSHTNNPSLLNSFDNRLLTKVRLQYTDVTYYKRYEHLQHRDDNYFFAKLNKIFKGKLNQSVLEVYSAILEYKSKFYISNNNDILIDMLFLFDNGTNEFLFGKAFYYSLKYEAKSNTKHFVSFSNLMESIDYTNIFIRDNLTKLLVKMNSSANSLVFEENFKPNELLEFIMTQPLNAELDPKATYHNYINIFYQTFNTDLSKIEVFQHLTEDVYIEKNEFEAFLVSKTNKNITWLYFSEFIDQELSSDFVGQYYVAFKITQLNRDLKKKNKLLEYPIHFRYQPPENKQYSEILVPLPYIKFSNKQSLFSININSNSNIYLKPNQIELNNEIINQIAYEDTMRQAKSKDYNSIFQDELQIKTDLLFNHVFFLQNKNLKVLLPCGNYSHYYVIVISTILLSLLGFAYILVQLCRSFYSNLKFKKE